MPSVGVFRPVVSICAWLLRVGWVAPRGVRAGVPVRACVRACDSSFGLQLSTDFGPELQNKMHQTVVPSLIAVMDDAANPRVQVSRA